MNKEKGIMLASLLMLTLMSYAVWLVLPDLREIGEQRREGLRSFDAGSTEKILHIAELKDTVGRNIFLWKNEKGEIPLPIPKPRPPKPKPPKPKPPKPVPPKPPPPVPPPPKPQPVPYKPPVAYVGTVKTGSERPRQVIFRDQDSGEYIRLVPGQEYRGITLIEIKANKIRLRNKEGKIFTLP